MQSSRAWGVIGQRRRDIADILAGITDADWDRPSLCSGWTIREVAGHLLQERPAVSRLSSRPWSLMSWWVTTPADRSLTAARAAAARPIGAMVADLRALAGRHHRTENPFWTYVLLEVLVHGEDIARPLGKVLPMPIDAAEIAAGRAWRDREWHPTKRLEGFRLTADDTDWAVGTGPRVSGSISQLLMLLTGRDVVVDELGGPGRTELAARLRRTD